MGRDFKLEHEWLTHGLRCYVMRGGYGWEGSDEGHRCGYVIVPADHPWAGKGYGDEIATEALIETDEMTVEEANEGFGVMNTFIAVFGGGEKLGKTIDTTVRVHGGVTFASTPHDDLQRPEGEWAFGFDTAHLDDCEERWPLHAVIAETESMAAQIKSLSDATAKATA
jgi:hypothetical protein